MKEYILILNHCLFDDFIQKYYMCWSSRNPIIVQKITFELTVLIIRGSVMLV